MLVEVDNFVGDFSNILMEGDVDLSASFIISVANEIGQDASTDIKDASDKLAELSLKLKSEKALIIKEREASEYFKEYSEKLDCLINESKETIEIILDEFRKLNCVREARWEEFFPCSPDSYSLCKDVNDSWACSLNGLGGGGKGFFLEQTHQLLIDIEEGFKFFSAGVSFMMAGRSQRILW